MCKAAPKRLFGLIHAVTHLRANAEKNKNDDKESTKGSTNQVVQIVPNVLKLLKLAPTLVKRVGG